MGQNHLESVIKALFNEVSQIKFNSVYNIIFLVDYYNYVKNSETLTSATYTKYIDGVHSKEIEECLYKLCNEGILIQSETWFGGEKITLLEPYENFGETTPSQKLVKQTAQEWVEEPPETVASHINTIVPRGKPKIKGEIEFSKLNQLTPSQKQKLNIDF